MITLKVSVKEVEIYKEKYQRMVFKVPVGGPEDILEIFLKGNMGQAYSIRGLMKEVYNREDLSYGPANKLHMSIYNDLRKLIKEGKVKNKRYRGPTMVYWHT